MSTVVIVHGTFGSPQENWFPWLAEQVRAAGHAALVPTFPTPGGQSLESWRAVFEREVKDVGGEHILVGHSIGVPFIFDVLQRASSPVRGSFLVSGFAGLLGDEKFDTLNRSFVTNTLDWKRIKRNAGTVRIYFGDNDPYVPQSAFTQLAEQFGVMPHVVHGGGHLNTSAGFTTFDALWEDVKTLL